MKSGRIEKAISLNAKAFNDEERSVTSFITTDAVDRYNEVVDPDGMDDSDYAKNPVVLLNHSAYGLPIGTSAWRKREGNGIVAKTIFADTAEGNDIYKLYKDGMMKAWSIGFYVKSYEAAWDDDDVPYDMKITKWELLEYSAVTIPANPEALTNALEGGSLRSERIKEIVRRDALRCSMDAAELDRVQRQLKDMQDLYDERVGAIEEQLIQERRARKAIEAKLTGKAIRSEQHECNCKSGSKPEPSTLGVLAEKPRYSKDRIEAAVKRSAAKYVGMPGERNLPSIKVKEINE